MANISTKWKTYDFLEGPTPVISIPVLPESVKGELVTKEFDKTFVIPAGAEWVTIYNAGDASAGGIAKTGTVNGEEWSVGRRETFKHSDNNANNLEIGLPQFKIDANGSWFEISYLIY